MHNDLDEYNKGYREGLTKGYREGLCDVMRNDFDEYNRGYREGTHKGYHAGLCDALGLAKECLDMYYQDHKTKTKTKKKVGPTALNKFLGLFSYVNKLTTYIDEYRGGKPTQDETWKERG